METWAPDEMLYVVGAPQADHFRQLFTAAKMWGLNEVTFKHISFGTVLGEDGLPLKSRTGESPKLSDLLAEAQSRARATAAEKNSDLSEAQLDEIGRVIGIGALKYADLSQNRVSDYIFSWDKMLAFQGNSAPYLIYAYVRVRSIFRKAQSEGLITDLPQKLTFDEPSERELVKFILRYPLEIETALSDYRINAISDYLFSLSQKFTAFYDACPVLKSNSPQRESRLALWRTHRARAETWLKFAWHRNRRTNVVSDELRLTNRNSSIVTQMKLIPTSLPGVVIIEPRVFDDARGFFFESYHAERFAEFGIQSNFVQDNHARSARGTLRGLHYQHQAAASQIMPRYCGRSFRCGR